MRPTMVFSIAIYVCAAAFVGIGSWPSVASGAYTLDPVLSLTGDCSVDSVDPVPDPGDCPVAEHPLEHPPAAFSAPRAVTTDSYGNLFVASFGPAANGGVAGRIDVFDPVGHFITEVPVQGPLSIAIDSKGRLYAIQFDLSTRTIRLIRLDPTVYHPASGEIAYSATPTLIKTFFGSASVAADPADDHIFVNTGLAIIEFSAAEDGNVVLDESIGSGELNFQAGISVAVDAAHDRLFASDFDSDAGEGLVKIFELSDPHALLDVVDASETPGSANQFGTQPSVAVDEGSGNFFIYDGGSEGTHQVYEFGADGAYRATLSTEIEDIEGAVKIWVDNGTNSPNGALKSVGRYLFVPSHPSGVGHAFAYKPVEQCAPTANAASVTEVSRNDAELQATIEPCNLDTSYIFEITPQTSFEVEGFNGAVIAASGSITSQGFAAEVTGGAVGLSPETQYRFRIVATNTLGSDTAEAGFWTYPAASPIQSCSNSAVRIGFSAPLPDCRAYELVTPPDTNARNPFALGYEGPRFGSLQASPSGERVSFQIEGGSLPGVGGGTGSLNGDPYLSTRGIEGWSTTSAGPNGEEAVSMIPGSFSPEQTYSFWNTTGTQGTAVIAGNDTAYVRYPDGHSELVGRGSLGTEPRAGGLLISEGGTHIIFTSGGIVGSTAKKLEPNAPTNGTRAIYDRTADGFTHVVSLFPGDITPAGGQDANYQGASFDGRGIAFTIGDILYLRYDHEKTYEIGNGVTFAGVAEGGSRIFYLEGGKLIRFDALTGNRTDFNTSSTAVPVNVSADGAAAYFVSTGVLSAKANPTKDKAQVGEQNLYLSEEGTISFVGTLTEADVDNGGGIGLGSWTTAVGSGRFAIDPSRTTPDGSAIVFESRGNLTDYDSNGNTQVYRYDSSANTLQCLSCNPTGGSTGSANLQSLGIEFGVQEPLNYFARLPNMRADGRRAFFQSTEALVPEDTDGLQDVYEWESQGMGSCSRIDGCIYLISSGQSERIDYLYAISGSGDDVFFRSSDLLLPVDTDETPSIYDARVGGGFLDGADTCQEEQVCRGTPASAPSLTNPVTNGGGSSGRAQKPRPCTRGKRKVKPHGKVRCIKKHRKHRAGSGKGGANK